MVKSNNGTNDMVMLSDHILEQIKKDGQIIPIIFTKVNKFTQKI